MLAYLASHEGTGEMRDRGRAYLIERNKKMGKDEGKSEESSLIVLVSYSPTGPLLAFTSSRPLV